MHTLYGTADCVGGAVGCLVANLMHSHLTWYECYTNTSIQEIVFLKQNAVKYACIIHIDTYMEY